MFGFCFLAAKYAVNAEIDFPVPQGDDRRPIFASEKM